MSSLRARAAAGPSRILRRGIATTASTYDSAVQRGHPSTGSNDRRAGSSSMSTSAVKSQQQRTADFLYGENSGWKKPRVPRKPATPPKIRPKVDPRAYMKLPPLQAEPRDRRVEYSLTEGQSNDRRAYFASDIEGELGGADWGSAEIMDEVPGLETGRVVECRRSGQVSIGLILASIAVAGRQRLLLLRSSGEIWPVSSNDVQFVMPSSLIPPELAGKCWSPELLQAWASTASESTAGLTEESIEPTPEMMDARRKVAMTLRKVMKETEKMCGRLVGGVPGKPSGTAGGAEGVWQKWAPESDEERASITAVEAAEYILNPATTPGASSTPFTAIRPNTLPAYAAHVLLMRRPDLFTADQGDMWSSGTFVVRSRAERTRMASVQSSADTAVVGGGQGPPESLQSFVAKAKAALELNRFLRSETGGHDLEEAKHYLAPWTESNRDYISILLAPLVETRSTQTPPSLSTAISIARLIAPEHEALDRGTLAHMLQDMGVILPWDSLEMSKITELEQRSMVMASVPTGQVRAADELLKGNELDGLREDYTSHKVYVIDDPTASELDDGIAVERVDGSDDVWIHVHIADPTRFIAPSHPLALQASVRGSSVYLPEGNKPLFPLEVIMKELSLGADVQRDDGAQGVVTFSARLSRDGQVQDSRVKMGWIKKPRVVTYQAVDEALGVQTAKSTRPFGGSARQSTSVSPVDPADLEDLTLLRDIAKAHRSRRYATAGLEWSIPSASVSLLDLPCGPASNLFDPASIPSSPRLFQGHLGIDYRVSSAIPPVGMTANSVVAEFMILAGRLAASFCHSRHIPVIYRGSQAPRPMTAEAGTLEDLLASRVPDTGMIDPYKTMSSGWYRPAGFVGLSPLQHWIMGFDKPSSGYVRATSPLRRFDDILVHWQIKAHLAREAGIGGDLAKGFTAEEVSTLVKRSDEGVKRAKRAGTNAQAFWQAQVLQRHMLNPPRLREGWEINEAERVDLGGELVAKIAGATEAAPSEGGEMTRVVVESLGAPAKMIHSSDKGGFEPGQEFKVKMDRVTAWPNPTIKVRMI
ncbi:hypothetical protein IAU60_003842 [Kwoniella sp. DSM 27419]